MPEAKATRKIAILGGGVGSLSAAYYLTHPDRKKRGEEIQVTLYQLGWRLGGKCATGRGGPHSRIEEHGIHGFCGWYNNSFRMLREIYGALDRPAGTPLSRWAAPVGKGDPDTDAFLPEPFLYMMEQVGDGWEPWPLECPTNDSLPGVGSGEPTGWEYAKMAAGMARNVLKDAFEAHEAVVAERAEFEGRRPPHESRIRRWLGEVVSDVEVVAAGFEAAVLVAVDRITQTVGVDDGKSPQRLAEAVSYLRDAARSRLERVLAHHTNVRRLFYIADLLTTVVIGGIRDGVWPDRYDSINHLDFREWLLQHGAAEMTVESPLVLTFYNLIFANARGDTSQPGKVAAGSLLRFVLRTLLSFNGSVFWKMNSGTAEVLLTPLYEILKQRGVRFEFFHRARAIEVGRDESGKARIERVRIGVQATLPPGTAEYAPLMEVNGVRCWPSEPHYEQLEQGDEIREWCEKHRVSLESDWSGWPDVAEKVLNTGEHFDQVVIGIPIAALEAVGSDLKLSPRFDKMFQQVQTVQTLAMQLWLKPTLKELGWSIPLTGTECPVDDTYKDPFCAWADSSHLLKREVWQPGEEQPRMLAYFCGPFEDAERIPGPDDIGFPGREHDRVRWTAIQWLRDNTRDLWPEAGNPPAEPDSLNWALLVDEEGREGAYRFGAQFWRANIDASERYTLSIPGTTEFRIEPFDTDFSNLAICGDWTRNGIDIGCVEATVVSGMLASYGATGFPALDDIYGRSVDKKKS